MADPLSVTASVIGFIDYASALLKKTFPDQEVYDRLLICQKTLDRGLEGLSRLGSYGQNPEILQLSARHTVRILPELEEILQKSQKLSIRSIKAKEEINRLLNKLEYWCKIFGEETNYLKMAELHVMMARLLETKEINNLKLAELHDMMARLLETNNGDRSCLPPDISGPAATEDRISSSSFENLQPQNDTTSPMDPIIPPAGASASNSKPSARTYSVAPDLEEASKRLYDLNKMGTGRLFLFHFVIVSDEPGNLASTPFHVKLDSGCELNWISSRVLKRAKLEGKQEEIKSAKAWLGFNGESDLVVPQATITLTWYSVNAAYTHRHEFLIHDDVPFDVVLGSDFIIEEGWKKSFNDPNLALRYSDLSGDQLEKIHQKARQSKEEAEGQIQTERAMKAKDREMRRRLNMSRTGTPRSTLTPHNDVLSRRSSIRTLPYAPTLALSEFPSQQTQSASGNETEATERQDTHSTRSKQSDSQNPQSNIPVLSMSAEAELDQSSIAGP